MAKDYISIDVRLDSFGDDAIKAYCVEHKLFSVKEITEQACSEPMDEWLIKVFRQIAETRRGIYTKEDLKDYINDIIDNKMIVLWK